MDKPDIGVFYNDSFSSDVFDSFELSIKSENLKVLVQDKPNDQVYACAEWYIPAAVIIYIGKSYFDGFLKEMGKDHYLTLKEKLTGLTNEVMSEPRIEPVLFGSKGKISGKNPFSMALAIHSETIDGYTFKLLIPKATEVPNYSEHINNFLEFLSDYHIGITDLKSIGYNNEFSRPPSGYIFVQYNNETQNIEWLDEKDYR